MTLPEVVSIEIGTPSLKEGARQGGKPLSGADIAITPTDSVIPLSGKDADGSWVKVIIEGKNVLWGYMGVSASDTANPDGEYTISMITIMTDENLDLEASGKKESEAANLSDALTPVFKDGRNELAYMIGGLTHRFFNDEKSVPVTAEYTDVSDMKYFTVDGTYSDSQTGETAVTVSVNTDFYSIEKVTAITDNGTAYAITPKPDGVFRPTLKKTGGGSEMRSVPGEEILWKDGLNIMLEPIPEGKYMKVAVMAESIGGSGRELLSRPVMVKANPHIASNLAATHREGIGKLLGRFAVISAVPKISGEEIMAATGGVLDIKQGVLPNGAETIIAVQGLLGEAEVTTYMDWCMEGLPFISRYIMDEDTGKFELFDRSYALLVTADDGAFFWKMIDSANASPIHLVPLSNGMFSTEYLKGAWVGEDGSRLAFENGQGSYFPPEVTRRGVSGQYAVQDNIVTITSGQQSLKLFFALLDENSMIATYKDSLTAIVYQRKQTPAPPIQTPPIQTPPVQTPPIQTPPLTLQYSFDGVWGAVVNGMQAVMQIQGNQYQVWLNGMPFEAGMFTIQGNMMYGQTTMGMQFSNIVQWGANGTSFSLTNTQNGMTVVYQRIQ
jgi:hypothetical protein